MSSVSLNNQEINVLRKGLKFCPTPAVHEHQNIKDMNNFCRKLRLAEFFHDKEINNEDLVKPSSAWIPERGRNEALDISIEYLQSLVKYDSKNTYNNKSNISKEE